MICDSWHLQETGTARLPRNPVERDVAIQLRSMLGSLRSSRSRLGARRTRCILLQANRPQQSCRTSLSASVL